MRGLFLKSNKKFIIKNLKLNILKNNECRIKVVNVGVCSSDVQRSFNNKSYKYPLIMGHEICGRVIKVGKNIKKFKINDKVSVFPLIPCNKCNNCSQNNYHLCNNYQYYGSRNNGGYCDILDIKEWNLIKIPKKISYENAAMIEPLAVVISAIKKLNINYSKKEFKILIIGSGFLGLLALKIFKQINKKINISIIDKNSFKLKKAKKISSFQYLENKNKNNKYLKNQQFDYILEATGSSNALQRSLELASNNANIVWIGNVSDKLNLDVNNIMKIIRKEIQIRGSWNSKFKNKKDDDWIDAIKYLNKGLNIQDIITHRMELENIPEFIKKINNHKNKKNKFSYIKGLVKL